MLKPKTTEIAEDFYEKTYLIISFIMKNIFNSKACEKFLKVSFLDSKILSSLKVFIKMIKKAFYRSKRINTKKGGISLAFKFCNNNSNEIINGTNQTGINFLPKSVSIILKYTEKCKLTYSKTQIFWKLKKFLFELKNRARQFTNLHYKKSILKFCQIYFFKKKNIRHGFLKNFLFFDCFSNYNSIYIF